MEVAAGRGSASRTTGQDGRRARSRAAAIRSGGLVQKEQATRNDRVRAAMKTKKVVVRACKEGDVEVDVRWPLLESIVQESARHFTSLGPGLSRHVHRSVPANHDPPCQINIPSL